jgi:hypothetical protein
VISKVWASGPSDSFLPATLAQHWITGSCGSTKLCFPRLLIAKLTPSHGIFYSMRKAWANYEITCKNENLDYNGQKMR